MIDDRDRDWLLKNGFSQVAEWNGTRENGVDKEAFKKTFRSGLEVLVFYKYDETLFYARVIGPEWIEDSLNLSFFETFAVTAYESVKALFERLDWLRRKLEDANIHSVSRGVDA